MAPSRGVLSQVISPPRFLCQRCLRRGLQRSFATTASLKSGHNRWSKIKHDKAKADSHKNARRSIFSQEIATASRISGPDPDLNPRLADLISKAKKEGFAKSNIEAAIARGQGRSAKGEKLENVTIEGMMPVNGGGSSVGVVVECETDSKARTLSDVRLVLKEAGGTATPSSYLFQRRGRVVFEHKNGVGLEEMLDAALDAGAEDIVELEDEEGGGFMVFTDPESTRAVGTKLAGQLKLEIRTSEIMWCPNEDTKVGVDSNDVADEIAAFVDELQEKESTVQTVAINLAQGRLSDNSWKELQSRIST